MPCLLRWSALVAGCLLLAVSSCASARSRSDPHPLLDPAPKGLEGQALDGSWVRVPAPGSVTVTCSTTSLHIVGTNLPADRLMLDAQQRFKNLSENEKLLVERAMPWSVLNQWYLPVDTSY